MDLFPAHLDSKDGRTNSKILPFVWFPYFRPYFGFSGRVESLFGSQPHPLGGFLNYEQKAVYKCAEGFTAGGEYCAPDTYNVQCLPSGQTNREAK